LRRAKSPVPPAKLINLARHQFAVIALAVIALASSFWTLLDLIAIYSKGTESFGVVPFEERFDLFRKSMPPRSVFGYISDNPATDVSSQSEFFLTQYTLVPAIVKESTEENLLVGNFHTNKPDAAKLRAKSLVLLNDFGHDVFLVHNTAK
jgi:hypothetical protein